MSAAENALFYLFSTVAVAASLVVVTRRHPLPAALALVVTLASLSGLYALLTARLIAVLQILVYAGAIVALIVFVIMFLNVRHDELVYEPAIGHSIGLLALALLPVGWIVYRAIQQLPAGAWPEVDPGYGGIHAIGIFLFDRYLFAFEYLSVLLLVALVGVVVLARRRPT